jgi:hypothetical protein
MCATKAHFHNETSVLDLLQFWSYWQPNGGLHLGTGELDRTDHVGCGDAEHVGSLH